MLVAITLMLAGLFAGIAAVQFWGLRMAGVITVPILAIYGLYDFPTLPVFVLSVLVAYLVVAYAKTRSFIYGRQMLLLAIVTGALVPVVAVVLAEYRYGFGLISEVEFVGTILPGIAAYNFHQLSAEKRTDDALLSLGVLTGLTLLGVALLRPAAAVQTATGLPPILLSQESDVAAVQDIALSSPGYESVVSLTLGGGVIVFGFLVSEFVRGRWGFRADGIVGIPLLAVFAFQTVNAVVLYLLVLPITYLLVDRIEAQTGLYGRVSLATALVISILLAALFTPTLRIESGLVAFFTGLFAGIAVYNFRRVPATDRFHSIVITAGLFVVTFALLRAFATPTPGGLLETVHAVHVVGGGAILVAAVWIGYRHERMRPDIDQFDI